MKLIVPNSRRDHIDDLLQEEAGQATIYSFRFVIVVVFVVQGVVPRVLWAEEGRHFKWLSNMATRNGKDWDDVEKTKASSALNLQIGPNGVPSCHPSGRGC